MARFLILFLMISQAAFGAAVPSGVPAATGAVNAFALQAATSTISTSPGTVWFTLYAGDLAAAQTAGNFYPLYGGPGGAGSYSTQGQAYRVTTGKTATCMNIVASNADGTQNDLFQLMSATASFAFNAASVTGGVFQGGATGKYTSQGSPTVGVDWAVPGSYKFDAGTFAGMQPAMNKAIAVRMGCFEY